MCVKGNLTLIHQSCLPSCFFKRWGLGIPWQFPGGASGKESACQGMRCEFDSWVGKILWRRRWQPTPVFLPGEFHGQRRLAGYSPWGHKELGMTEHTHTHSHYCLGLSTFTAEDPPGFNPWWANSDPTSCMDGQKKLRLKKKWNFNEQHLKEAHWHLTVPGRNSKTLKGKHYTPLSDWKLFPKMTHFYHFCLYLLNQDKEAGRHTHTPFMGFTVASFCCCFILFLFLFFASFHFCWEFQPLLTASLQGHTFGQTLGPKTSSKHRDAWESQTGTTDYFSSKIFCFHLLWILNSLDMTLRCLAWPFSHWHIYPNSFLLFSGIDSWSLY